MVDFTGVDLSRLNPERAIQFINSLPEKVMSFDYQSLWWLWLILGCCCVGLFLYQLYRYYLIVE